VGGEVKTIRPWFQLPVQGGEKSRIIKKISQCHRNRSKLSLGGGGGSDQDRERSHGSLQDVRRDSTYPSKGTPTVSATTGTNIPANFVWGKEKLIMRRTDRRKSLLGKPDGRTIKREKGGSGRELEEARPLHQKE